MKHFKFKFNFFQFTDEESPSGSISPPPPDGGSVNDWVFLPPNLQTTVHTSGMSNVLLLLLFKNALYLSVNIFSAKVLIGDTIFLRLLLKGGRYFTWSSEPREGLAVCRSKEVHSFLSYFKTLSSGPVPGIKPVISRSAVKCSFDWVIEQRWCEMWKCKPSVRCRIFYLYFRNSHDLHSMCLSFLWVKMNSTNRSARSVWVIIAQVVEHSSRLMQRPWVVGWNPCEALQILSGLFTLLKLRLPLWWSYLNLELFFQSVIQAIQKKGNRSCPNRRWSSLRSWRFFRFVFSLLVRIYTTALEVKVFLRLPPSLIVSTSVQLSRGCTSKFKNHLKKNTP